MAKKKSKASKERSASTDRGIRVFLNVPYDQEYEGHFIALIASLTALGLRPVCALEVPEQGEGRLKRIIDLMKGCALSIHDLSRVEEPRFNMPFELGIICGLRAASKMSYSFVLLDSHPHRLDQNLSDIKGIDCNVYGGDPSKLTGCILSAITNEGVNSTSVRLVHQRLQEVSEDLRRESQVDFYSSHMFGLHIVAAAEICRELGLGR